MRTISASSRAAVPWVALFSVAATAAEATIEVDVAALLPEEAAASCDESLSLRQLRTEGIRGAIVKEHTATRGGPSIDSGLEVEVAAAAGLLEAAATPEGSYSAEDFSDGVPGGWGEPDKLMDELKSQGEPPQLEEQLEQGTLQGLGHWGSCAKYSCDNHYVAGRGCQCNRGCRYHGSCCWDYWDRCSKHSAPTPAPTEATPAPTTLAPTTLAPEQESGNQAASGNIMTLYHQTGMNIGPLILANGFKSGSRGWCGGGIYFAETPEATFTKAIGADSHTGFMIEAKVDMGKLKHMPQTCDTRMTGTKLKGMGYDSVTFNPGDGPEFIVYNKTRVISVKHVPL